MSQDILVVAYGRDGSGGEPWIEALRHHVSDLAVQPMEQPVDPARVRYVAAWRHRPGTLANFPHLRAIFSLGAGVDHLMADAELPAGVPIVRVVDPDLTNRMSEWVLLSVLMHHRQLRLYDWQQNERHWQEDLFQPAAKDVRVGVMGLGVLGRDAARKLHLMGFDVAGWSQTPKDLDGIETFAGTADRSAFLARTQILVVLLPLTPDTREILDYELFEGLARDSHFGGPILINGGRGGLQNEDDILRALEDGTLRAANLDVFHQEPLPPESPFWHHPAVTLTPHSAAVSSPPAIAGFIAGEIAHIEDGGAPRHVVDPIRLY